jgi:hypothetical protein
VCDWSALGVATFSGVAAYRGTFSSDSLNLR